MIMPKRSELDEFIRRGPNNGDVAQGLIELRYRILTDGIPANSDGMVRRSIPYSTSLDLPQELLMACPVRLKDIHLAYPTQRSPSTHRYLSRPGSTRLLTRLHQNSQRHLPYSRNRSTI